MEEKSRHLLYIHQYFKTPSEPGGTRSYWISQELIDDGYNVTMLTARNDQKKFLMREYIDGIRVVYIRVRYKQSYNLLFRLFSFVAFMLVALSWSLKHRREFDIVFGTSTPLTIGVLCLILRKCASIRYVFEVRDLWPEVPIQMGAIKNKLIIELLKYLEKAIYENAEQVIALSPGMLEGVNHSSNKVEAVLVPNMAKPGEFYPRSMDINVLSNYGIDRDKINLIYFGAIGQTNGMLDFLIHVKVMNLGQLHCYIVGTGSEKDSLREFIAANGLKNVKLIDPLPMKELSELVNCMDISLVSFADVPILATNSPNKLFDSLSAGLPILVNSPGWTKDLVEQYNCGFYYSYHDTLSLKNILSNIDKNSLAFKQQSLNSRELSKDVFDRKRLCRKVVNVIDQYV